MLKNTGPWRDGKYVVATHMSEMPRRCMVCGNEVRSLHWIEVPLPRSVPVGGIAGGVLFLVAGERFRVQYGRCERHRIRWTRHLGLLAGVAIIGSMIGVIARLVLYNGRLGSIGISLLVLGALSSVVIVVAMLKDIRIGKSDGIHVWITGFGEPYLASLPTFEADGTANPD